MNKKFLKMQGAGNDYILFDCFEEGIYEPEKLSRRLSDRHFSVGGDGIILVEKSPIADGRMRMFNADGSEGKMCGNGIRLVGKFLFEEKGIRRDELTVETASGVKKLFIKAEAGEVVSVTVDMGRAELAPEHIPVRLKGERAVNVPLLLAGEQYFVTCVSMGNPHCVVFCEEFPKEFDKVGRAFEEHKAFPQSVNTEFIRVINARELFMRVWERGSGETLACGTGACAAVVAAVLNGYCKENTPVTVHLRGGDLGVTYTGERVYLTGAAETAFTGEVQID